MKPTNIAVVVLLAASAAACGSNPNKELKEARAEEAESRRERSVESTDQTKERRLEAIENRTDRQEERAERLPEGTDQRAKAQSEMTAARQKYLVETQARVAKVDARLVEARRKLQIAGGRAPTPVWDNLNLATKLRSSLATQLQSVPGVPNDRWGDETKRIDARVGELESSVDDVASKADGLAP